MSYGELRSFTETMRSLGYPRPLPLSTFFRPNFQTMSDILKWLIDSFSSSNNKFKSSSTKDLIDSSELPIDLSSETDRILFVKSAATLLASKLNIKLNTKKLYQADVHCISELSKLASVLRKAMFEANASLLESQNSTNNLHGGLESHGNKENTTLEDELGDISSDDKTAEAVKILRALSVSITDSGKNLSELLSNEVGLNLENSSSLERTKSLNNPVQVEDIEKHLKRQIQLINRKTTTLDEQINRVAEDEKKMDDKIKAKKQELNRAEQRLETLKSVRPAFQDEFDEIELQVKDAYDEYLVQFRNLSYLKSQIEEMSEFQMAQARRVEQAIQHDMNKAKDLNYNTRGGDGYDEYGINERLDNMGIRDESDDSDSLVGFG